MNNWIRVNNDAVIVESYQKIRDDILEQLVEIYNLKDDEGNVLPLLEYSSDGIFAQNLALGIWNMGNLIQNVYEQHNIDYASGRYLDKVMALNGFFRIKGRKYILEITLDGSEVMQFGEDVVLFDVNNQKYEFNFYREKNILEKKYLIVANDFYPELLPKNIKDLNLRVADLDVYQKEGTVCKLILNQAPYEDDVAFKERVATQISPNTYLTNQLMQTGFINGVILKGPETNVRGIDNRLQRGEMIVLINFNHLFYQLSIDEQEAIKNEIEFTLLNAIPIGIRTIPLEKSTFINPISKTTSVTDFINQSISYNELILANGAIGFNVKNLDIKRIDNLCEDLINQFMLKELNYDYNIIDVRNTIGEFFSLKDDNIFIFESRDSLGLVKIKSWESTMDGDMQVYYASGAKFMIGDDDTEMLFSNLKDYQFQGWKINLTKYMYRINQDGSFAILLYGGGYDIS